MSETERTKHTPGPWEVENRFSCHSYVKAGARILFQTECNREHAGESEESKANARLIAAAPEMLSALKASLLEHEAIHEVTMLNPVMRGTKPPAIIATIRAAISKAEEVKL